MVVRPPGKLVEPVLPVRKQPARGQPVLEHLGPAGQPRELLEEGCARYLVSVDPEDPVPLHWAWSHAWWRWVPSCRKRRSRSATAAYAARSSSDVGIGRYDDLVRDRPEERQDRVDAIAGILGEAADGEAQLCVVKQRP